MDKFKCSLCSECFKSKFSLDRHHNKKNKCNDITPFQCKFCSKYFKFKKNLVEHEKKNICNHEEPIEINIDDEIKTDKINKKVDIKDDNHEYINQEDDIKTIKIILQNDDFNVDNKIIYFNRIGFCLEYQPFKTLIESSMDIDEKVQIIKQLKIKENYKSNYVNNGTINTNQTTNVIVYGSQDFLSLQMAKRQAIEIPIDTRLTSPENDGGIIEGKE